MSYTKQVDLSILLQNTEKPAISYIDRSSTKAVDVTKLDVCFGGFTPMALSDGTATREQVLSAEKRERERREAFERAAALEAARTSEERAWVDEEGTIWRYVLLDEAEARIVGCSTSQRDLVVPSSIEGKPVVSLGADSLAFLRGVESISLPETLVSLEACAMRQCPDLLSIEFPDSLPSFDSSWLRSCNKLESMRLPGALGKIDARIFDLPALRELKIGAGANEIEPGAFQKSHLERIEVDPENPLLETDGRALYTANGAIMVALAVPGTEYTVREGCRGIAKKGFSNFACIERIDLPDSIDTLGPFALASTSIEAFVAPPALKVIGEKAFFNCEHLASVTLNEGLLEVMDNAFTGTKIGELRLPASVEKLGNPLADKTSLTYVGPQATFTIAEGSEHLLLDDEGCLYRKTSEGLVLDRMMNPDIVRYEVREGTASIADDAFSGHAHLCDVVLPEGLAVIGKRAFKACRNLVSVQMPRSVRVIEGEAFLDTALTSFTIPAALEELGGNALVTFGAHHGSNPSLHDVQVEEGSGRFYRLGNLLLERKSPERSRVLLCVEDGSNAVRFPPEVDELAPYALNGIAGINELYLSERITSVGMRALGIDGLVEHVRVELEEPVEGHYAIDLHFPSTDRSAQQQMLALSVPDHVDARVMMEHYDAAIVNASSFDYLHSDRLALYDQATRLMARLKDPIFLTQVNRSMCDRIMRTNIGDICVEAAKHDDRRLIDDLLDFGFVNGDNINEMIDRVGAVQDASITGYLLEAKRERFGMEALDFDL